LPFCHQNATIFHKYRKKAAKPAHKKESTITAEGDGCLDSATPHVEEAALTWFGELGYTIGHGPHIAPDELAAERDSFGDVVLVGRLREERQTVAINVAATGAYE